MYRTKAQSIKALVANTVVEDLQRYFVSKLNTIDNAQIDSQSFEPIEWFAMKVHMEVGFVMCQ